MDGKELLELIEPFSFLELFSKGSCSILTFLFFFFLSSFSLNECLSNSRYTKNLPSILEGDQAIPSVHLLIPECSSMNTNTLPDFMRLPLSLS